MSTYNEHQGKDYYKAHQYSSQHRKQILNSPLCGCFYCIKIFSSSEILEWIDENDNGIAQTALCPYCGIDSVISSESGFPITTDFLKTMMQYWFNEQ
jgi:hypothetical protein